VAKSQQPLQKVKTRLASANYGMPPSPPALVARLPLKKEGELVCYGETTLSKLAYVELLMMLSSI